MTTECRICGKPRPCGCFRELGSKEYQRRYQRVIRGLDPLTRKADHRLTDDPDYHRQAYWRKRQPEGGRTWAEYVQARREAAAERLRERTETAERMAAERLQKAEERRLKTEAWRRQMEEFAAKKAARLDEWDRQRKEQEEGRRRAAALLTGAPLVNRYRRRVLPTDTPEEKARKRREYKAAWMRIHGQTEKQKAAHELRKRLKRGTGLPADVVEACALVRERIRTAPRMRCHWCHRWVKRGERQVDHVVPLAHAGEAAENPLNLCCACAACNHRKGAQLPQHFSGQGELFSIPSLGETCGGETPR